MQHPVILNDVTLTWPNGDTILEGVTATFSSGRTGIVGDNGAGKSTLLHLVTGRIRPTSGSVTVSGRVGLLPQTLALRTDDTLADLLGVRTKIDALRAIEGGDASPERFDELADDWDIEARIAALLPTAGLDHLDLDRPVGTLSGGETILAAIVGLQLSGDDIVCLDEPTNNLDAAARERLHALVDAWRGNLLVVSHDTALLDRMDATVEVRRRSLTVFGGGYSAFRDHLDQQQDAARRALTDAQRQLAVEKRQRIEAETKLARRKRYADTDHANKRKPKIIMNQRRSEAQNSAGRLRIELAEKEQAALDAVTAAEDLVRDDQRIRIDLPDPGVGSGRRLAEFTDGGTTFIMAGPERVGLTGPNGIGKTLLLTELVTGSAPVPRRVSAHARTDRIGYLPQRLDTLDEAGSILDNIRDAAPHAPEGELRRGLARFLFRGDAVERPVRQLSGGERFRVCLARLLLADPPLHLLVLDEPTNNLDLTSVDQLVDALASYRGGLVVVSHDERFLDRLHLDHRLHLHADEAGGVALAHSGWPR